MERKLETIKGRMKWFLGFINPKIKDLSNQDLFRLWNEIREIAFGEMGRYAIRDRSLVDWPEKRDQAVKIQTVIKDCLVRVLSTARRPKKWMIEPEFNKSERDVPEGEDLGRLGAALEKVILAETQNKPVPGWARDYIALPVEPEMRVLADGEKVMVAIGKVEVKLLMEFLSVLSQVPLNLIEMCQREDCGNYFFRGTKKPKRYCSNKCAWVIASRERRSTQPGREREKKMASYKRAKMRETGHKNLKIQKRRGKTE